MKTVMADMAPGSSGASAASTDGAFSIALGGGAARGLAHIAVLEALDELGVAPTMIAGTSMGAIIGAVYASGMPARDIRAYAVELLSSRINAFRRLFPGNPGSWASVFAFSGSAVLAAETLMSVVLPPTVPASFDELAIPLRIVTADYHRAEEFVISSGPLHKAIGASSCLPVLLAPVKWDNRILVDGGFVNPTPFDLLEDQPGPVLAVDVTWNGVRTAGVVPSAVESWVGAAQIALHSLVNERLKRMKPDLLIRPDVSAFGPLQFHRISEILAVAEIDKERTKRELGALLDRS